MSWKWIADDNGAGNYSHRGECLSRCKNQNPCNCANGYCLTTSECKEHIEWDERIQAALVGCDSSVKVTQQVSFLFCGIELTLYPDGTYSLDDTTGG